MSDSATLIPNINEIMKEYIELGNKKEQDSQAAVVQVEDRDDEKEKRQQKGEESRKRKRELIPHPTKIPRLYILAGVKGIWVEEETCPKVSPLTLTGVIKGLKGRKRKEMEIVEVAEEHEEEEEEQVGM